MSHNNGKRHHKSSMENLDLPLLQQMLNGRTDDGSIPFADDDVDDDDDQTICDRSRRFSATEQSHMDLPVIIHVDEKNPPNKSSSTESLSAAAGASSTATVSRRLRRNSISMPTGLNAELNMQHLLQERREMISEEDKYESQAESVVDDASESVQFNVTERNANTVTLQDADSDDEDNVKKPIHRDRFRNKRRASIAPLPALRLNSLEMIASDYDTYSIHSNQTSITSINSIASLVKEKVQSLPQIVRKKKEETKDYKTKVFVISQFFVIIFLISYSYIMYHREILKRSYFEKMKFNPMDRIFRILDHEEREVILGFVGFTLGWDKDPYSCLTRDLVNDGSVCLEWDGLARLYLNYQDRDVFRCYTLKWLALGVGTYPTDCYELHRDNGIWFGGSITKNMDWALSAANFSFSPFTAGDARVHQFGNGIKRYFLNSNGIAIQVSDKTPLYLSVNRTENRLCIRAMNDDFSFVNRLTPMPELEYKICITEDMRSLHMLMTQRSLWDGLKEADLKKLHSIIEEPVWKIPFQSDDVFSINETIIYNYSEDVIAMGFMRLGHILVNEFWQENMGDFTVDRRRFPTLKDTIDVLHRRGFKVVFTIQPFISTDSPSFKEGVMKNLLIYERYSERSIPALTRYKTSSTAGVLDVTNNASIAWVTEKLEALQKEFQVDSFYLDLGMGYNLPYYYQCRKTLVNPDMYAQLFTESFESIGFIGVSTASSVPRPPAFLSIPPANSSWQGLRDLLTTVLNYGVIGYPFVLPGAIGGDYRLPEKEITKMISFYSFGQAELPSQELFIRWLQLSTFLPSMQFSHLPSEYKSDYITNVTKELTTIRQKTVIPLLKKYISESMNEGLPLVRPLWMLDPHDPACLSVSDEFSIGGELIVAPVLKEGADAREVYLPQGVWKDGIDGSLRKGSRWIHGYKVPTEKIAHFVKMPDNTRF